MQLHISKLIPSAKLKENEESLSTLQKTEEIFQKEGLNGFIFKNDEVEWDIYKDPWSGDAKTLGIKFSSFIFKTDDKYIIMKMNINFNLRDRQAQMYIMSIKELRNFKSFGKNGVNVEIRHGFPDIQTFTNIIGEIGNNSAYIMQISDTTDITQAIKLYKQIDDYRQENESEAIPVTQFIKQELVRIVDYKSITGESIEKIKLNNNTFIKNEEINKLAEDSYSKKYLLISTGAMKLPRNISKTLRKVIQDNGNLTYSKSLNKESNERFLKLVDYKVERISKTDSRLILVVDNANEDLDTESFINIYDRLSYIKSRTMLSVVEDIEKRRIGNNNLFEYLFNNGEFDKIPKIDKWEINKPLLQEFSKLLNEKQLEAFIKSTDDFPVTFIQGPPGTGKTYTITQLCKYYAALNKKVLVSSQTNVAVENILENLTADNEFQDSCVKAEFGGKSKFSLNSIQSIYEEKLSSILNIESVDLSYIPMSDIFTSSKIIGSTTTSSSLNNRVWRDFSKEIDVLIVDEISKSSVPELIRYAINAKKIIFVGDQKQLAPLDEFGDEDDVWNQFSEEDRATIKEYISISIFDKLFEDMNKRGRAVMLQENRRSVKGLLDIYSIFYDNQLIPTRSNKESKIEWNNTPMYPFTFMAMNGSRQESVGTSKRNILEAEYIDTLLENLSTRIDNKDEISIAIIATYGAQVKEIKKHVAFNKFNKIFKSVRVNTVDAFQGDQADIVIISTVITDNSQGVGFIRDYRRLNVAISRAKDLAIVLGNDGILRNVQMQYGKETKLFFNDIFEHLDKCDTSGYEAPQQRKKVA